MEVNSGEAISPSQKESPISINIFCGSVMGCFSILFGEKEEEEGGGEEVCGREGLI